MAAETGLVFEGTFNNVTTGLYIDNTTNAISEADLRALVTAIRESYLNRIDDAYTGIFPQVTASGTDTYTATLSPAITAYVAGQKFQILFTNANTGAATLALNGLAALAVTKNGATALSAGDIAAGSIKILAYDGTRLQIVGDGGASGGTSIPFGSTTGTNTYSATMSPAVSAYANGDMYHVRVNISSTGVVTFDLGPGAKKAFDTAGAQAADGYFKAGVDYLMVYNTALDSAAGGFSIVNELVHGIMNFRGTYTPGGSGLWPSAGGSGPSAGIRHGDIFVINGSDTLGAKVVNTGDFITTDVDAPGQTDSNWYVIPGPASLALKANLASPTFTGTPAAPTAAVGTNTTQIATTAFVQANVSNLLYMYNNFI